MSVFAYTGLPGSGKTYQVVFNLILPAMRQGRRVLTNIEGIKEGSIQARLQDEGIPSGQWGAVVYVDNETVKSDNFYYHPEDSENSIVKPGDLLVIDEAWEFYEDGAKFPERAMNFFRYHRHYSDPVSGVTCDVILISQDVMDIGRKVRRIIHQTILINKMDDGGLSNHYRLEIYSKTKIVASRRLFSEIKQYEKFVFTLYDSHRKTRDNPLLRGKEVRVEKRGNVFNRPFFKYVLPLAFVGIFFFAWLLYDFLSNIEKTFHIGKENRPGAVLPQSQPQDAVFKPSILSAPPGGFQPKRNNIVPQPSVDPDNSKTSAYTLSGYYVINNQPYVLIEQNNQRKIIKLKAGQLADFNPDYLHAYLLLDGEIITSNLGAAPHDDAKKSAPVIAPPLPAALQ